ncbi:MAG: hypothetical protein AAF596_01810 [Planctomycetota bacterium]
MGVPMWLLAPIGGVLLIGVLLWPSLAPVGADGTAQSPDGTAAGRPATERPIDYPRADGQRADGERPSSAAVGDAGLDGFLTEVRPKVFRSPAGLIYAPGSAQGHRVQHVMAHARDQPSRPGPHGVFDADEAADVLAVIDRAYRRAAGGGADRVRREEGRTIYTVDLGERIGYIGGQTGNARGRPGSRRLRLILEGKSVITAYPVW